MESITQEPEDIVIPPRGIVISSSNTNPTVSLIVTPTDHPTLYSTINSKPGPSAIKLVKVRYAKNFRRVIRTSKSKLNVQKTKKYCGRPSKGIEWHHYQQGGPGDCYSCGRQFAGRKGKQAHLDENRGSRVSCEVVWIQSNRDRCYFCDLPIKPSKAAHIIEQHTKVCKPLSELKTLIHPYHLKDTGLRIEEIGAFNWPGKCKQGDS
jgi:hypothetical protein